MHFLLPGTIFLEKIYLKCVQNMFSNSFLSVAQLSSSGNLDKLSNTDEFLSQCLFVHDKYAQHSSNMLKNCIVHREVCFNIPAPSYTNLNQHQTERLGEHYKKTKIVFLILTNKKLLIKVKCIAISSSCRVFLFFIFLENTILFYEKPKYEYE